MKAMVCVIFNVDHGFCAFVKSPNGYGLLVDCGSRSRFSPIKWVRQHYSVDTKGYQFFEGRRIASCIITHLHADHFDDVGSFYREKDKPKILTRDKKVIGYLQGKISDLEKEGKTHKARVLRTFKKFSNEYNQDVENHPDWGFDFFRTYQLPLAVAQAANRNREKVLNNRSYIIGIGYAGKKVLIPGDVEVEGWKMATTSEQFKDVVRNTTFFVASHHGHTTGFTTDILRYSGKPEIYIVSAKRGDTSVDSSYSKPENSKGYRISGRAYDNRMISTREEQKSVEITVEETGATHITLIDAEDNLSENQSALRNKKTERRMKDWQK